MEFIVYRIEKFKSNASGKWCECGSNSEKLKEVIKQHCSTFTFTYHTAFLGKLTGSKIVWNTESINIDSVVRLVTQGVCFMPFSVNCDLHDVLNYLDLGLDVYFLKASAYHVLRREYKKYI